MVLNHTIDLQARDKLFSLQDYLLLNYDMSSLYFESLGIHPKYPFIHLYTFKPFDCSPKSSTFSYGISVTFTILLSSFPLISFFPVSQDFLAGRLLVLYSKVPWFHNPTQWISLLQQEKSKWSYPQTCWIEVHCSTLCNKSVKQAFSH